jgi:predicted Fe-Mo cluster-binding NifX family protein
MILIPLELDEKSIAKGFRKAPMFVFIDPKSGITIQENHFKRDKSALFFENFKHYDVDKLYVKGLGYKTYLKLRKLGIDVSLIPENITYYTHIDPNELVLLTEDNAQVYCTMGHHNKKDDA